MIIEIFNKEDIINNERDIKIIKVITNKWLIIPTINHNIFHDIKEYSHKLELFLNKDN